MVKDVADVATVVHIRATGADTDNVSGRGDVAASGKAQGGVRATGSILTERTITDCCVALAGGVAKERSKPMAVLPRPSVLLWSAEEPLAVLKLPVALVKSALSPMAVFWLPVVLPKSAS